jgi:FkbM family methyltransferase
VEESMKVIIQSLANKIKDYEPEIQFKALEVGALNLGEEEKFHAILKYFPGSEIIGFEVDEAVCKEMNDASEAGMTYYAQALGARNENRAFYETNAPMCGSLFKPNETLLRLYHNFEVAYLKKETTIDTMSLDSFLEKHSMCDMDFIKIDVEGSELRVLQGMSKILRESKNLKIFIEFMRDALEDAGSDPEELLNLLEKEGFTIYYVDDYKNKIVVADKNLLMTSDTYKTKTINLLCIKEV